ncbi:MAG: uroporphyrinogen decarboxylase family protein [Armatimonadota bacterium]
MKPSMTERERFLAVATGQQPDYVPIFGFDGAPGMSGSCLRFTYDNLVATGMPPLPGGNTDVEAWRRYWGTAGSISLDFAVAWGEEGIRYTRSEENGFIIVKGEDGSVTREVQENSDTYSMPEFKVYPVRDRASWEFYKERIKPRQFMSPEDREQNCRRFDDRKRPLTIFAGGTFGVVRSLMGTEAASLALYDDPELVYDIINMYRENNRRYVFPLIERLRPEVVMCWEDIGYKTSMLISPEKFREFCVPLYKEVADCARACGVPVMTVDSDGCAMQLAPMLVECGMNSMHPFEVKGGNDLFALREQFPELVMFGWLEKEIINEGNEHMIEHEIMSKVSPLLAKGRYFPNGDHGIQPPATFDNLRKFMTILHEVCGNPEGEFPRVR